MLPENPEGSLAELQAEMNVLKTSLAHLQQRMTALHSPGGPGVAAPPVISSTRRKVLKRLGLALLGGATAATVIGAVPAQARFIANPAINGLSNKVGALILPPGAAAPTGTAPAQNPPYTYGLIASGDISAFNLSNLPAVNVGVYGSSSDTGVMGKGVRGVYANGSDTGVLSDGTNNGVIGSGFTSGVTGNGNAYGVIGTAVRVGGSFSISPNSVYGTLDSTTKIGLIGAVGRDLNLTNFSHNYKIGVYGLGPASGTNVFAGYFEGNTHVNGVLTKNSGTFKIDHPLDPENKYLSHSFVESPDMMNIYNGIVTLDQKGEACVEMPDWFEALNMDFRYQLTALDRAAPDLHIGQRIIQGCFKIAGGLPGQEISWQVTGIRQDAWANAHRVQVEENKSEGDKGKLLHPEVFGKSSDY